MQQYQAKKERKKLLKHEKPILECILHILPRDKYSKKRDKRYNRDTRHNRDTIRKRDNGFYIASNTHKIYIYF